MTIAKAFAGDGECRALDEMARCPRNDAEKALQSVVKKFDLTLNVPTTQKTFATNVTIPVLLPEDFIRTLSDKGYLNRLVGGSLESRAFVCNGLLSSFVILFQSFKLD